MTITQKFIDDNHPCSDALVWGKEHGLIGKSAREVMEALIKADKLDWANWLIVRVLPYKGYVSYAVFAAEQVIDIYEKKYPNDKRPREAIEAAKKCIKSPMVKNKKAAAAAYAAAAAAYAAYAAAAARRKLRIKILEYGLTLLITMTITPEEARQDVERENHQAIVDRENYEEGQLGEDEPKRIRFTPPTLPVSPDPEITKVVGYAFQCGESIFDIAKALFCAIPDTFKVEQLSDELLNLVSNKNK